MFTCKICKKHFNTLSDFANQIEIQYQLEQFCNW